MANIWYFIVDLVSIVINIGEKIWQLLTTPIIDFIDSWNLPGWLDVIIGAPLRWIFQNDATLLTIIPLLLAVILVIRVVMLFIK